MSLSRSRHLAIASGTLVMLAACVSPTQPDMDTLKAGDSIPVSYRMDDQEIYAATYRIVDLVDADMKTAADASTPPTLVAIVESLTATDSDATAIAQVRPTSASAVKAFLRGEWNAYLDPASDSLQDATNFVAMLADNGLDAGQFLTLLAESKLKVADYIRLLNAIDDEGDAQSVMDSVYRAEEALLAHDLSLADLATALSPEGSFSETAARRFFQNLYTSNQSLWTFLDIAAQDKKSLSEAVKATSALQTQAETMHLLTPFAYDNEILAVANNRLDTNASLRILNPADTDAIHYRGGRPITSAERSIRVGGPNIPLVEYRWKWAGTMGMTSPPNMLGQGVNDPNYGYVKDMRPVFSKTHAAKGWKLTARTTQTLYRSPLWNAPFPYAGIITKLEAVLIPGLPITFHDICHLHGKDGLWAFESRRGMTNYFFTPE